LPTCKLLTNNDLDPPTSIQSTPNRCPPEAEVRGSNPLGRAIFHKKAHLVWVFLWNSGLPEGRCRTSVRQTAPAVWAPEPATAGRSPEQRAQSVVSQSSPGSPQFQPEKLHALFLLPSRLTPLTVAKAWENTSIPRVLAQPRAKVSDYPSGRH